MIGGIRIPHWSNTLDEITDTLNYRLSANVHVAV